MKQTKPKLRHFNGDITKQKVDVIVNAADESLLGGGGVDAAIHQAAGPRLLDECRTLNGCAFGDAKLTGAYNLDAKFVIHAVGPPIYAEHDQLAPLLLASAYKSALQLADSQDVKSIAFPAISTGAFGYPKKEAAEIAITVVKRYFENNRSSPIEEVRFVSFDKETARIYKRFLAK